MASIRKRAWVTPAGERKSAWIVDYKDSAGKRHTKNFARRKDAETWRVGMSWEVRHGIHTADSQSISIREAAKMWLDRRVHEDLEPTTIAAYDQHIRLHINPICGEMRLNQITTPMAEELRDQLAATLSRPMAKRVLRTLTAIVAEAQRRGRVAQNVFTTVGVKRQAREKAKAVIPSKRELRALVRAAHAHNDAAAGTLVMLLIFTGLRASELRGLSWRHVDLRKCTVSVVQRANAANIIGPPKSAAGNRSIPIPNMVAAMLRAWKLACKPTPLGLVFPSLAGAVMSHPFMTKKLLDPVQAAAGLVNGVPSAGGRGRYTLHDFRHAAASLWIEQGVSAKCVQTWMGHSSIQVTFDTYGHLFSDANRDAAVAHAIERDLADDGEATWMLHAG